MGLNRRIILINLAATIGYLLTAVVVSGFGKYPQTLAGVPPELGLAVAVAVIFGLAGLPGVFAGVAIACAMANESWLLYVLLPAVTCGSTAIAARCLRKLNFDARMLRVSDVLSFLAWGAILPSLLVAVAVAVLRMLVGQTESSSFGSILFGAFAVSLSSTLVLGAFVLVASRLPVREWFTCRAAQMVSVALAVVAVGWIMRSSPNTLRTAELLALLLLAGVYGQPGAVLGALSITWLDALLTYANVNPFGEGSPVVRTTQGSLFMSVATIAALFVAAAFHERHLAEATNHVLEDTARTLAEAQDVGEIGSFVYDPETDSLLLSHQAAKILGLGRDTIDLAAINWLDCVMSDDRAIADAMVDELLAGAATGSFTARVNRGDKVVQWAEVRLRAGEHPAGCVYPRLHGTVQDITARRVAELRAEALFENAPYPIVVADADGCVVRSNHSADVLFDVGERGHMRGCTLDELMAPVGVTEIDGVPWYAQAAADPNSAGLELWAQRRHGPKFAAEAFVNVIPSEHGVQYSVGLRDTTKGRELVDLLNFQARHDPLTELPNRAMFVEELELALDRARDSAKPLAVIFADLDNFKAVNDCGGHEVGDLALGMTAGRLLSGIRDGDLLARFGGDEFVILCENLASASQARAVAQRVADAVAGDPFELGGHSYQMSLSAGLLLVEDPDETTVDSILRAADRAMYTAKVSGKRRVSEAPTRPAPEAALVHASHLSLVPESRHAVGR